ncbi:MAG: hypothetical protein KatS3mg090_0543 [Patescibacteria group bacterium]|nr:MAG: hypothetical protein KatS3mg090_0543 [Patescibacteria group bacterium]
MLLPFFPKKIRFFLNANAVSFKKKYAIKKALMEGFERLSFVKMENKYLYYTSYNQLLKKFSKNLVVNPKELIFFSKEQFKFKKYQKYKFSESKLIWWTKVKSYEVVEESLNLKNNIFFPASLIFFLDYSALSKSDEYLFKVIDSNGLAAGFSYTDTLNRALLELIERDVYTIYFFVKLKPKIIITESLKGSSLFNIIEYIESYNFKLYLLYLENDFKIPVIVSILEDRSRSYPKILVSAKADLDVLNSIKGAILEVLQGLIPMRDLSYSQDTKNSEIIYNSNFLKDNPIIKRLIFWARKGDLSLLNFWIKSASKIDVSKIASYKNLTSKQKLRTVCNRLYSNNIKNIFIKTKKFDYNKKKVYTIRCFVPELCPIFIDQNFKYLNNKRLQYYLKTYGKSVNKLIHPLP